MHAVSLLALVCVLPGCLALCMHATAAGRECSALSVEEVLEVEAEFLSQLDRHQMQTHALQQTRELEALRRQLAKEIDDKQEDMKRHADLKVQQVQPWGVRTPHCAHALGCMDTSGCCRQSIPSASLCGALQMRQDAREAFEAQVSSLHACTQHACMHAMQPTCMHAMRLPASRR